MAKTYKIVCFSFRGPKRTVKRGLTLEEAQKHCSDPQTASRTCTTPSGKARTKRHGDWFHGYEEE